VASRLRSPSPRFVSDPAIACLEAREHLRFDRQRGESNKVLRRDFGVTHMLQLRPNCECCDVDLPPESTRARICSFECTFCATCADGVLGGRCPNCGGELLPRPRRPDSALARHPPSAQRIFNPAGCAQPAA
jgi:hypothetical protein